jgi:hypothetical protein
MIIMRLTEQIWEDVNFLRPSIEMESKYVEYTMPY